MLELKEWRREVVTKLWKEEGLAPIYIIKAPDDIIMPDDCVLALAKNAEDLTNLETLISFLKPWYGVADQFAKGILACIQKTIASTPMAISNNPTSIPVSSNYKIHSQVEQRAMLKAARALKKLR